MMNLCVLQGPKSTKPDNVRAAIAVMKRVEERGSKIDMGWWNNFPSIGDETTKLSDLTELDVHECGTACCFAGWLALSPEFRKAGGKTSPYTGSPIFQGTTGSRAVAKYLGIHAVDAEIITYVDHYKSMALYDAGMSEVSAGQIITALEAMLPKV